MSTSRRTKKYVAKEEQTDEFFFDVRYKLPYDKRYTDRTIAFIFKQHIKLKESLYHSDSLFHLHYIRFVFDLFNSFKRAYESNPALSTSTLYKTYSELIEHMNKTGEKLSLATFYCMHLERPDKTGKILANAAMYTLGSAFCILYASYMAHGNVSTKQYHLSDGTLASASEVAKQVLMRNMAEIENSGVITVEREDDASQEQNDG